MKYMILLVLLNHVDGDQTVVSRIPMPAELCHTSQRAIWDGPNTVAYIDKKYGSVNTVDAACVEFD